MKKLQSDNTWNLNKGIPNKSRVLRSGKIMHSGRINEEGKAVLPTARILKPGGNQLTENLWHKTTKTLKELQEDSKLPPKEERFEIGTRVVKYFKGHGYFAGQVTNYSNRNKYYRVVYADGDSEDLTHNQVNTHIITTERNGIEHYYKADGTTAPHPNQHGKSKGKDRAQEVNEGGGSINTEDFITPVKMRKEPPKRNFEETPR